VAQQKCTRNKTSGLCKLPAPNQSHLYIWSTHVCVCVCVCVRTHALTHARARTHSHMRAHTQALSLCRVSLYDDLVGASGHTFLISSFVTPSLSHKPHCIDLQWYLNIRCFKSPFKNTSTHMHFTWSFIMILTNERKIIYYTNTQK